MKRKTWMISGIVSVTAIAAALMTTAPHASTDNGATEFTRISTPAIRVADRDQVDITVANVSDAAMDVQVRFVDEGGITRGTTALSLKPGTSRAATLQIDGRDVTQPRLLRAVIQAEVDCPPSGGPGALIARGSRQLEFNGTIDDFAACPVQVCSGLPGSGRHDIQTDCSVESGSYE